MLVADYGPIWVRMDPYGSVWTHMVHMGPYAPIWAHMGLYIPICQGLDSLYIPIYPLTCRSEGISLRDMLSLGALGWGLDGLGKFFRRRRPRRPLVEEG